MYSSKRNLAPYEHRMEMCRLSFVPESSPDCQVSVKDLEKEAFVDACAAKPGKKSQINRKFYESNLLVLIFKTVPISQIFPSNLLVLVTISNTVPTSLLLIIIIANS